MSAPTRDDLDAFLIELNRASAAAILPMFRAPCEMTDKARAGQRFDPVTAADKAAEAAIRKLIGERHPDHGVIGEEYGEDRPDAAFVWVIDPIDGTRAFLAGLPLWATLIALRHDGRPVMGGIGQPYLGELFIGHDWGGHDWGGEGDGARLLSRGQSTEIRARTCPGLEQAVISTTDPGLFAGAEAEAWGRLHASVRLARYGCDSYAYAMVALGQLDLVVESGLKAWDIDALRPVIAGAGGQMTDWEGAALGVHGGRVVAAGDRRCAEAAMAVLAG